MYVYNLKINGGFVLKLIIILLSIFMVMVFGISIYRIFFTSGKFIVDDKIEKQEITEISQENYTNILQAVHDDIDSYVGMKIKFIGYVYRVIDFEEEQFVLARDMLIEENSNKSVVVGFLSEYKNAKDFEDGMWVEITGSIEKGKYHNQEMPIIKIIEMKETSKPENSFVSMPSDTYIPTSGLL